MGLTQFFIRNWSRAPFGGRENYGLALELGAPIGRGSAFVWDHRRVHGVGGRVRLGVGAAGAQLVNTEFRGHRWFRTLFLVPYAMPVYVAVIGWSFMLDRDNGALNALLGDLHLTHGRPFWLFGTNAFWSIVMTTVWRLSPFAFLMALAGMQNIPRELYEAAAVDAEVEAAYGAPYRKLRSVIDRRGCVLQMSDVAIAQKWTVRAGVGAACDSEINRCPACHWRAVDDQVRAVSVKGRGGWVGVDKLAGRIWVE